MKIYCLVCNEEFEADVATYCPCCGAVGDDLEPCDEEEAYAEDWEPTEEDLEAMYEDYEARRVVENRYLLMGAI